MDIRVECFDVESSGLKLRTWLFFREKDGWDHVGCLSRSQGGNWTFDITQKPVDPVMLMRVISKAIEIVTESVKSDL